MVRHPKNRYLYEKVRLLRTQGRSYGEIKDALGVSKGSISFWCDDITLTPKQQERLRQNRLKAPHLGGKANHDKRERQIHEVKTLAREEINTLTLESFKIGGALLYWAEGAKTGSASISNSDPRLIEFMVWWFKKFFDIPPTRLKSHLHIHYGNDDRKIKTYWSRLTGIPLQNFGKSFIKPKGTGHRTNILPNGIIKIRVSGIGTGDLRHRIAAWSEKAYYLSRQYQ